MVVDREDDCSEEGGEESYSCLVKKLQLEESRPLARGPEEARKATFGAKRGLQVILDKHSNLDSAGTIFDNDNGFKVYLGQPTSFPMLTRDQITLSTGKH